MTRWGAQLALTLCAFASAAHGAQISAQRLKTTRCSLPRVPAAARCGVLRALENPAAPRGRRLAIHFAVLPALSPRHRNDPLVLMMGGPGEDAISDAADAASQFIDLRGDRDILLVDQRGAGQSAPLRCKLFSPEDPSASVIDLFPTKSVAACARELESRTDLTRYTYDYAARDLEQIRRGLGYGPFNLVAFSYGTRFAQVYMREYPRSVRTAYLGSVVPIDLAIPLTFARAAQAALINYSMTARRTLLVMLPSRKYDKTPPQCSRSSQATESACGWWADLNRQC